MDTIGLNQIEKFIPSILKALKPRVLYIMQIPTCVRKLALWPIWSCSLAKMALEAEQNANINRYLGLLEHFNGDLQV